MRPLLAILLAMLYVHTNALKFLAYNPQFGKSHVNFFSKLADALVDAGHEVVMLSPRTDVFVGAPKTKAKVIEVDQCSYTAAFMEQMASGEGTMAGVWKSTNIFKQLITPDDVLLAESRRCHPSRPSIFTLAVVRHPPFLPLDSLNWEEEEEEREEEEQEVEEEEEDISLIEEQEEDNTQIEEEEEGQCIEVELSSSEEEVVLQSTTRCIERSKTSTIALHSLQYPLGEELAEYKEDRKEGVVKLEEEIISHIQFLDVTAEKKSKDEEDKDLAKRVNVMGEGGKEIKEDEKKKAETPTVKKNEMKDEDDKMDTDGMSEEGNTIRRAEENNEIDDLFSYDSENALSKREYFDMCVDEKQAHNPMHLTHSTVDQICGTPLVESDPTVILSPFTPISQPKTGSRKRKTEMKPADSDDDDDLIIMSIAEDLNDNDDEEEDDDVLIKRRIVPQNLSDYEKMLLDRIANLEREKTSAIMAMEQKDRKMTDLKERNQKLDKMCNAQREQLEKYKAQNDKLMKENRQLKDRIDSIETQLKDMTVKWNESQDKRYFLEQLVDQMKESEQEMRVNVQFEYREVEKERAEIEKREKDVREKESTVVEEDRRMRERRESLKEERIGMERFVRNLQQDMEKRSEEKVSVQTESKKAKGTEKEKNKTPRSRVKFSLLKIDQKTHRLKELHGTVVEICGPCHNPEIVSAEVATVVHAYMKRYGVEPAMNDKFTAIKDLEMSLAVHLSQNQRNQLKTFLFKSNIDVLAPTDHLRKLREFIKSHYKYNYSDKVIQTEKEGEKSVSLLEMIDVKRALKFRLENVIASGQLESTLRSFDICISGDAGKASTKLVMMIGGVNKANDVQNLLLLAKYDGDDSSEMIRSLLNDVIAQVNALTNIEIDIDGETVSVELVHYLTGDYKFLWAVLGMGAATSRYNCIWCWRENKYKMSENEPVAEPRTLEEMRNRAKRKERCMSDQPLFDIPPDRIIPGTLHTLTGVAIRLTIVPLQVMAKNDDLAAAGLNIVDLNQITDFNDTVAGDAIVIPRGRGRKSENGATKIDKALKQKKEEMKESKQRLKDCDIETKNGKMVERLFVIVSMEQRIDPAEDVTVCSRQRYCLSRDKLFHKLNKELCSTLIKCDICNCWYHYACEGRFSYSEHNYCSVPRNKYTCLDCCESKQVNGKRRQEEVQRKLKEIETTKAEIEKEISEQQNMIEALYLISIGKGKVSLALVEALQSIGADLRTWGQCLTGNHIRKCLKDESIEILCNTVSSSTHTPNHKKIMHCLKVIQNLAVSRPLFNYEMIFLRNTINELEKLAGTVFPNVNRFPKAHALFAHVPEFAKRYGQWGLFTDQPTEKLHQFLNTKDRQYNNIRRKDDRWLAQANDLAYTNYVHDIKPPTDFDPHTPKLRGSYKKKNTDITATNSLSKQQIISQQEEEEEED